MTEFTPPAQLVLGDLEAVIRNQARRNPRSHQKAVGPSELGQACERRLALTLLGAPKINHDRDEWTSTVGTALHTWMEGAFKANNNQLVANGLPARWLVEQTVHIAPGLDGHCDVYDLYTNTVLDHKFPGVSSIRKYQKQGHPGQQYIWQAHLYGLGWRNAGLPVREVAICMYPRSGLIRDAWLWREPYSVDVAIKAIERRDQLLLGMNMAEEAGALQEFLRMLRRDTEHCSWCEFHQSSHSPAADPGQGCSGVFEDVSYARKAATVIDGIL